MVDLNLLKLRLDSLCVFRDLLGDAVMQKLHRCLGEPCCFNYAEFVSSLYRANGGNISSYIQEICENSDNVYVRSICREGKAPNHIENTLREELAVLQQVSELTADKLRASIDYNGFLPDYVSDGRDISAEFYYRTENTDKFGYGIYARNRMFYVDESGIIVPVDHPDTTELSELIEYERERQIIIDNTLALLAGKPAANVLITGDAGTGKSSTVKAVGNALFSKGLRIIEVRKDQLRAIPGILNELSDNPLKFILFIDDLSFLKDDDNFNALKAVLEGSVSAKSKNVVIYATSNRRHIIKEKFSDREGDEIHRNDTMQEFLSLSERFGIHITFGKPDKETFLKIVRHLAREGGITIADGELDFLAERFALARGGRSARLARQFVDSLLSRK